MVEWEQWWCCDRYYLQDVCTNRETHETDVDITSDHSTTTKFQNTNYGIQVTTYQTLHEYTIMLLCYGTLVRNHILKTLENIENIGIWQAIKDLIDKFMSHDDLNYKYQEGMYQEWMKYLH